MTLRGHPGAVGEGSHRPRTAATAPGFGAPHGGLPPCGRRHGDPFPLPEVTQADADAFGLGAEQLRRVRKGRAALNHLAAATVNSPQFSPTLPRRRAQRTAVQSSVIDSLCERVGRAGGLPSDLAVPELALRDMLASKDLYSQEPKHLAAFSLEQLRVAKGDLRPAHFVVKKVPENKYRKTMSQP